MQVIISNPSFPDIEPSRLVTRCPFCGEDISKFHFCPKCGLPKHIGCNTVSRRLTNTRTEKINAVGDKYKCCFKCGRPSEPDAKYCRVCGADMTKHAIDCSGHEWIDLGLSVLWAGENIRGGSYRWKDVTEISRWTKIYLLSHEWNKVDTASEKWGYGWRIPTKEEFQELIDKCKWEKVFLTNKNGYNSGCNFCVTGPNGNSILLPVGSDVRRRFNNNNDYIGLDSYKDYLVTNFWGGSYWTQSSYEKDFTAFGFFFTSKPNLIYETLFNNSSQIPKDLFDKFYEYYNSTRKNNDPYYFRVLSEVDCLNKNCYGLYPFEWLMDALKVRGVVAYEKIMETTWMSLQTEKIICPQNQWSVANIRPVKDR